MTGNGGAERNRVQACLRRDEEAEERRALAWSDSCDQGSQDLAVHQRKTATHVGDRLSLVAATGNDPVTSSL